jgi:putative endonuclease
VKANENIFGVKTMYVYILLCSDKTYYVGVTNDLEERFLQHCEGINITAYTFSRRPLKLVFYEIFNSPTDAIAFEKKIKKWSKLKKEALIVKNFSLLPNWQKKISVKILSLLEGRVIKFCSFRAFSIHFAKSETLELTT